MRSNRKKKLVTTVALVMTAIAVATLIGLLLTFLYARKNINYDMDERMFSKSLKWDSTAFYCDSGETRGEYTPSLIERSGSIKKIYYPAEEISPYIKEGFISVEDRIFYEHKGVDVRRTLYAALNYLFGKGKTFGASTITQQVVKNISGDNELSIMRKFSEIIRAANIERNFSKDQILEVYLNVIPMGEEIFGVGLASRSYFGKEPSELSPAEAATLIGITNAPTAYNPYNNPDACMAKRNSVLRIMYDTGVIDESVYLSERETPLSVIPRDEREDRFDSWFVEVVIDDASRDFAKANGISESASRILLLGGGYSVYTTMDRKAQTILEEYFENEENFSAEIENGLEYSMVITDIESGDLAAVVGRVGKKCANRILSHATAPHIPASTLKPLALYAPLIDSEEINWSTVFDDVPQSFTERNGEYIAYPANSPGVYDGLTTVAEALRASKNTVAIQLYKKLGAERIYSSLVEKFGFDTLVRQGKTADGRTFTDLAPAPLALGQLSVGVPLTKLVSAYGAFGADGIHTDARSYIKIVDSDGNTVLEKGAEKARVFKSSTARIMNRLLMQVTESGTARSLTLKNKINVAGKTGTSGGNRDKLFIGYTPYYAAGIWCGYDGEAKSVGAVFPSHIAVWDAVMTKIHEEKLEGSEPKTFSDEGLVYRPYCMDSGELYSDVCMRDVRGSRLAYGYFTPDNAPRSLCSRHICCLYDSVSKGVASADCPKEDLVEIALLDIPDRSFPTEVFVSDAELVYRNAPINYDSADASVPYFYYALPPGEFAGISKRERQFNCACGGHAE